jgi:hypothetical protein
MKTIIRWGAQYLLAAVTMFALLVMVDLYKGTAFADAWGSALTWAVVSSAIFIGARYNQERRNAACAICEKFEAK